MITSLLPSSRAMAELTTTETTIGQNVPLLITAYQAHLTTATTDTKDKVLTQKLDSVDVLEIYNSGNAPVDLRQWQIVDAADVSRVLQFTSAYQGYLTPGEHVVLAQDGYVNNSTYTITGWSREVINDAAMPSLKIISPDYRIGQTDIKISDTLEKRMYGVSSYLSTFVDAVALGTQGVEPYLTNQLFDDGLYTVPTEPIGLEVSEFYSYASNCDPLDTSVLCGDYVELHNVSDAAIDLTDLVLRTDSNSSSRASSNTFTLGGLLVPNAYVAIAETDDGSRISLTNSGGYVWLEDTWGLVAFRGMMMRWPSAVSDQQGFAYAHDIADGWCWTTTPTPGTDNIMTEPIPVIVECSAGKYRSPETGRCRTIEEAVSELATCDEGYERNPTTNRCRKIVIASAVTLTPCLEGQERNPATNRCRSIASAVAELMPCDEGYERNSATNRCRKTELTSVPSAPFAVEPTEANVPMWQWWAGGTIIAALAGYGVWEWRHEIGHFWRRLTKR